MAANDNKIINTFKEIKQRLQKNETDPEVIGSPDWKEFKDDSLIPLSSIFSGLNETSIGRDISKHLNNIINTFDRDDRYDRYRLAMKMPEIDGALDIYASETATQDEKGNIINVFCSSSKVEKIITDLFDRIGIEDKGFDIIKSMCGYGDEIYEIIYSKNGKNIHSINMIPREYVGRYEENGVLKNFFIRKSKKNREQRDSYYSFDYARINTKSENIEIEPFRILHWRINNSDFAPYGKSILDSVITPLEELRLMEQSLLLARISRAPERRLYYVNVGQAQGEKGIAMAREIVKGLKRKSILDRGNGNKLDSNVDFFSSTEDLVIPFRKDEEKSSVESLPQLNDPGQLQDLEFIRDRIFPGLGIPRQYLFDDTFSNANTALSNKSVQFAKRIRRIQKFFIYNLYKLAYIELKLKNIPKKEYEDLLITMNNPSNVDIREKLETESNKWNLVSSIKSMNSEKVFYNDFQIYQDVLGLNYDEILKLMVQNIVQEKDKNPFAFVPEDKRPADFLIIDQLKMEGQEEEEGEETGMEDVDGDGIPDEAEEVFGDMEPEGEVTPEETPEEETEIETSETEEGETPEETEEVETPEEGEIPEESEEDFSDENADEISSAFSKKQEKTKETDLSNQNADELIGAFNKKGKKTKETDLSNQNADELIGAFSKKEKKTKETDLSNQNADELIDIFSSFKPSDKKKKEVILERAKQRARRFTMKKLQKIDEDLEYDEIEEFQNEIKNNPKYTVPIYTEDYLKISAEFLGIEKIQEKQTYFEEK
jgi:hypothetical protein